MVQRLFTAFITNRKGTRIAAIGWTLFLFLLCLIPSNEVPNVNIPFIDKWVHFVLFAAFSFFWLTAFPSLKWERLIIVFTFSVITGWLVEELQGQLTMLGRSKDVWDIWADSVGGAIGVLFFAIFYFVHLRRKPSA